MFAGLDAVALHDWQQRVLSDPCNPEIIWCIPDSDALVSVRAVVVLGFTCDHVTSVPSRPLEMRIISAAHHLEYLMKRAAPKDHVCAIFSGGRPDQASTDLSSSSTDGAREERVLSEAAIMERFFRGLLLAHPHRWPGSVCVCARARA